jgi:hypothetical protein
MSEVGLSLRLGGSRFRTGSPSDASNGEYFLPDISSYVALPPLYSKVSHELRMMLAGETVT